MNENGRNNGKSDKDWIESGTSPPDSGDNSSSGETGVNGSGESQSSKGKKEVSSGNNRQLLYQQRLRVSFRSADSEMASEDDLERFKDFLYHLGREILENGHE